MGDLLARFVVGGLVVSTFAVLGDILKPKSFAGLFSAAPSVALATLSLAFAKYGHGYIAQESSSMIFGAVAFAVYAWIVAKVLFRRKLQVFAATTSGLVLWLAVALGSYFVFAR